MCCCWTPRPYYATTTHVLILLHPDVNFNVSPTPIWPSSDILAKNRAGELYGGTTASLQHRSRHDDICCHVPVKHRCCPNRVTLPYLSHATAHDVRTMARCRPAHAKKRLYIFRYTDLVCMATSDSELVKRLWGPQETAAKPKP